MPEMIFLMRWDPRVGPLVLGSYPVGEEMSKEFLLNVFGLIIQREEERLEGFYSVSYGGKNVVAYYSGQALNQVFGIVLQSGEDEEGFRGAMVRTAVSVFKKGEPPTSTEEWEHLWRWMNSYPQMNIEQRLGDAFRENEVKKLLSIMLESGVLTIDEVVDNMRTYFPVLPRDIITTYVHFLEALGIVSTKWDEKALIERVYLLRDVLFYRKKPEKYEEIAKEVPEYEEKYKNFASRYYEDLWESDQEALPELLGDPMSYSVIKIFREKGILEESDIPSEASEDLITRLLDLEIIGREGERYYLIADPSVRFVFPKYTISKVISRVRNEEINKDLAIEHLKIMRDSYLS